MRNNREGYSYKLITKKSNFYNIEMNTLTVKYHFYFFDIKTTKEVIHV